MVSSCFVVGCCYNTVKNKNLAEGKKVPSLFTVPLNQLAEWNRRIPGNHRDLTVKDRVCSLHFHEDDILSHNELKLANGVVWRDERSRYGLKEGAVPKIFSNYPSYLSDTKPKKKSPRKRPPNNRDEGAFPRIVLNFPSHLSDTKPKKKSPQKRPPNNRDTSDTKPKKLIRNLASDAENTPPAPAAPDPDPDPPKPVINDICIFNYETLLKDLPNLKLPANWWCSSRSSADKGVMLSRLTDDLTSVEKRIHIMPSMEVKGFLYSKQILLREFDTLKCIQSIDNLVKLMDGIKVCKNVTHQPINHLDGPMKKCVGFVNRALELAGEELCYLCSKSAKMTENLNRRPHFTAQQVQNMKRRLERMTNKLRRCQMEQKQSKDTSF